MLTLEISFWSEMGENGPSQRAVHTMRSMNVDGSTEWEKSSRTVRHGGIKSRSSRTVRKVTTVTRGEQSVTSESVMSYSSDGAQRYPAIAQHDKRSLKFRVVDDKVCLQRFSSSLSHCFVMVVWKKLGQLWT